MISGGKDVNCRLKNVISTTVNKNQVAHVNNRFIREGGRPISDVVVITNSLDIEVFLTTVDTEIEFDSKNHSLLCALKKLDLEVNLLGGQKS